MQATSAIIRASNNAASGRSGVDAVEVLVQRIEAREQERLRLGCDQCDLFPGNCGRACLALRTGDDWSAIAQVQYESDLVAEARAVAAGESDAVPKVEHIRVLLAWLDGGSVAGSVDRDLPAPPF